MNYVIENIKSRRSVRSFTDQEIPKKIIEEILDAGRFAPSALNKQTWKFIVIQDTKLIQELSEAVRRKIKLIYKLAPILKLFSKHLRDERTFAALKKTATQNADTVFYGAPALIFIVSEESDKWVQTNCALSAGNMMLAAHSFGVGSCFIGRGIFISNDSALMGKIGLKRGDKIYATLALGYPKEFPRAVPQRRKDNLVCWK